LPTGFKALREQKNMSQGEIESRTGTVKQSQLVPRRTLFDYVNQAERNLDENKYCSKAVLRDEASVEEFFVSRLLKDLGYEDSEIKPKTSLQEIAVSRGRKKENFRPDYALVTRDKPRWVVDAKSTQESVDDWSYQTAGYAHGLNQQFSGDNPCPYHAVTNGFAFKVYRWDEAESVLSLEFENFVDDDPKFLALRSLLGATVARRGWRQSTSPPSVKLTKPSMEEVKRLFKSCHDLIWKAEKMNPQPAFVEFTKIMFVKLLEDRKLHDDATLGPLIAADKPIPRDRLVFSSWWIEARESDGVENPVDRILFKKVAEILHDAVVRGKKKPIFSPDERIGLQTGTIKQVVRRLESYNMFSVDEDLNGRLFETFLSATMRGKALGQYFTPRSIVKLMTHLGAPVAARGRIERVIDACCGTGGFLIEVLTEMRNQVRSNQSLTPKEALVLQEKIANQSIFGMDAGSDPPLAKIARINMYLHGDGGSRIYAADGLDKLVRTGVGDDPQAKLELEEIGELLRGSPTEKAMPFDLALTNPPFSMGYSNDLPNEREILQQYALTTFGSQDTSKRRASLRSSIMFIERYAGLLGDSGRLVTVIDDAILNSRKNAYARDFIRDRFIIRAIVSIPSDAFQRVGARVKTSVLYLVKRAEREIGQPDVFMYECQYVGLDDVPMKTRTSKAAKARQNAERESDEVIRAFKLFLAGKKGPWLVSGDLLADRLDVKSCLPRTNDVSDTWRANGLAVVPFSTIFDPITDGALNPGDSPELSFNLLRVRYDGIAEEGEAALGSELTYHEVWRAQANDLVASNIALALGSLCVMPPDLVHCLASSEFTIMRLKDKRFDPWFMWGFLRSSEVRARLLSQSTGLARHRVGWEILKDIPVPFVDEETQKRLGKRLKESVESVRLAEKTRVATVNEMSGLLDLDNEWAVHRLRAAKPPK
jgi:type I restriction enzyme M protein